MHKINIQNKHKKQFLVLGFIFILLLSGLSLFPNTASAHGYPPLWNYSNAAVHFAPVAWPADSDWTDYTYQGVGIKDQRTNDPSNGGTSPQNYVNVSSQCTDQSTPSIAWYFDSTKNVLFFRWRVEQIANTYATGPSAGTYGSTDPWKSAQWTVMIDIDGDGYREFAFHLDGSTGDPTHQIDVVKSIYSNTPSQSLDYVGDPSIYQLFHNPTAFVDETSGRILNFRNMFSPSTSWPNGTSETVWDYGTTRSTNITTPTCNEYYIDYQIPLAMLDASSVGGPTVTANTPISLSFATANSLQNPLQKDAVFDGTFIATSEGCLPFGDTMTLGGGYIPQPVVDWVKAEGCDTTTLTAQARDVISASCGDTLVSVDFYYYYDKNANNIADDDGSSWTLVGSGTVDASDPSKWTSGWDTTGLDRGQYLIGVQAKDNAVSGNSNLTFSYLTTAELPADAPGETNYANPTPTPGIVKAIFNNSCGEYVKITKSASLNYVAKGDTIQFSINIDNQTSQPISVSSISDILPPEFTYVANSGGTSPLDTPTSSPSSGAKGTVTWAYSPAVTIPMMSNSTLSFTADTDNVVTGSYANMATALTTISGTSLTLTSDPVDIGVGAPRLTIAKTASDYSVEPNDPITYTITYSNDSPVNTTGVVITDVLPAGLNFIAADKGGTYNSGTRTIAWNIGNLASLEGPYTVSFNTTVDKTAATTTINTATITSNETTPASASASIYVKTPLNIDKVANKPLVYPDQSSPNNQVIYTIYYQNTGSGNLSNAAITDPTPPGFSYVSLTSDALLTGTAVETTGDGYGDDDLICESAERCIITWTASGDLAAGASGSVTLTLQANFPYDGDNFAVNTATMSATGVPSVFDTAQIGVVETGGVCYSNYFHDETVSVGYDSPPDRQISDAVAPLPSYTGAYVTIWAPAGASYLEAMRFYNPISTIDQPFSDAITTRLYIDRVNGNGVYIRGEIFDYDPVSGVKTPLGSQNQLFNGNLKGLYEFTITPTGGTLLTGHRLLWVFSARSSHPSNPVQLQMQYDGTVANLLSGTTPDTFAISHARLCSSMPELVITKNVDKKTAVAGDTLQYTINFANLGVNNATGSQITDVLPTGTTFVSATLNGTAMTSNCPTPGAFNYCASGQTYTFDAHSSDTAAAGQITGKNSGILIINALISASPPNSLTNEATITSNETDPVSDAVTTNIGLSGLPNISILKSASKTLLIPGDTVTYTLLVVNTGSGTAIATTVTDVMPVDSPYFTYVSGPGSITGEGSNDSGAPTLSWAIASSMAPGESRTLTYRMLVGGTVRSGVTSYNNTASATEGGRNYTSNPVIVSITANPILSITKTVTSPASYSLTVSAGDNALTNIPVQMNTLKILEDGAEIGVDSGTGFIIGSNLKNSTINYTTGALHLEFITAPSGTLTAEYNMPASPGDTLEYTITVTNVGDTSAQNVLVTDPVPSYTSYKSGSLVYESFSKTDKKIDEITGNDDDEAYFDAANNRTVFNIGAALAKNVTRTMKFLVIVNSVMPNGTTTLSNTATASSTNTASKSATALFNVQTAPVLTLSKSAPATVPYPLTTLTANALNSFTITVANVQYIGVGDVISVSGTVATVTAINTTTKVITFDIPVTAASGTSVIPTIKFVLSYVNSGKADATNVTVRDTLQTGLTFLTASEVIGNGDGKNYRCIQRHTAAAANRPPTGSSWSTYWVEGGTNGVAWVSGNIYYPSPSSFACTNSGQVVNCTVGTLPAGGSGSFIIRARPVTGTYTNSGLILSTELTPINSNATTTVIGAIELSKTTSTPAVVNSAGGTTASYTILLKNQLAVTGTGVYVTDPLPTGFTYTSTGGITGGFCQYTPRSKVTGTTADTYYIAKLNHIADDTNRPTTGANWATYWDVSVIGGALAWINGFHYSTPNQPTWNNCTINVGATLTIPFNVAIAPTVGAGTYQNPATAISGNMSVLPFDELNTTAEDVTVTIPGDLKIVKGVTFIDGCFNVGCRITYDITVTNVGTNNATGAVITDIWPAELNSPPTWTATLGSYAHPIWTIASNIPASTSATLYLTGTINTITQITNTATITSSTFSGGATDTNNANNSSTKSIIPTLVTLSGFSAYNDKGRFMVQWTTSSEMDTAGFYLFRLDENTGRYRQINRSLLPALLTSQQGGTYSLIDNGASLKKTNTYVLVEIEGKGARNAYGPFVVMAGGGNAAENQYSSNPLDPEILLGENAVGRPGISTQRQSGLITRFTDKDGTIVITNMNSKSSTGTPVSVTDEVSNFVRKAKALSAEKKARITARKNAKERARFLKKQRKGDMIKISVSKEGLYYIDSSEISSLTGISQNKTKQLIRNGDLAISSQGVNVAYLPSDDNAGMFFYGRGTDSIYTKENIYWLYRDRGLHMDTTEGNGPSPAGQGTFTKTLHAEEDKFAVTFFTHDPESDYWFWDYIVSGNPAMDTKTFTVEASDVADTSAEATLTVNLHGYTNTEADPDHHVMVKINGTIIGEGRWDAENPYSLSLTFSQKLLREGANIIELRGLLDTNAPYSIFCIDDFDLTYQRLYSATANSLTLNAGSVQALTVYGFTNPNIFLFDITDPDKPILNIATTIDGGDGNYSVSFISSPGAQYLATTSDAASVVLNTLADIPSSLSSKKNGADYIIITTNELVAAAQELANYRQGQGLQSMVVDVEDIMDEFNFGISSPEAIKDFLSHAYENWTKVPKYVLLAGEGSFDYKNNLGYEDSLVPAKMRATPFGLSPSDSYLADTDGDYVPDIAIGRLSISSAEELQNIIIKIRNFEAATSNRVLMVADYPDEGGNFPSDSDELATLIPAGYSLGKIYLSGYPLEYARQMLFDEIHNGVFFLNYIGHASVYQLSGKGLLKSSDITNMTSLSGVPVLTALSCVLGQYAIPGYDSLSEDLVVKTQGGAVAVWSATGMSFNFNSIELGKMFYRTVFEDKVPRLGDAVTKALEKYSDLDSKSYMLEIYNLQGDPALRLR